MARITCPECHGRKNIVVRIKGKREVVICPTCDGEGIVDVEEDTT